MRPRGKHTRKPAISQRWSTAMPTTMACGTAHVCVLVGMTKRDKADFHFTSAPEGIVRPDCISERSALLPCSCRRPEEASDGRFGNGFLLLLNIYSFIDMSSNLPYVIRYYTRTEGSLLLDNSRLVVVICFLLEYCGVKKTHSAVTPRSCDPSGNGRDRDGTERMQRRQHEFSQNYCPSYESFPRFPPNSQSTQVEGHRHTLGRIKTKTRHPGI